MLNEEQINNLMSVLEQEHRVYENILRLSKQKTDIIVEGKVSELDNIVKLEQVLVTQISRIEDQREKLLSEILPDKKGINISELKDYADKEGKQKLEVFQKKLEKVINELRNANQLNAKLIQNSLEYIEFSLNIMSNADAVSNNYGNSGNSSERERKNFFDMKL